MELKWLGHSSFLITSVTGDTVLIDPYDEYVGRIFPKVSADVVVLSHQHKDHSAIDKVQKFNKLIDNEGVYCYNKIMISAFYRNHDNEGGVLRGKSLITKFQIDSLSLCHMGDIGEDCSDLLVEEIGKTDVLFLPVGGTYTIDSRQAEVYVEKINPKIVIPMHFRNEYCNFPIEPVENFVELFDKSIVKKCDKDIFKIEKDTLNMNKYNIILMHLA
jgi:L-ascorbate metabolism protein UlaG (beta-lactamase superfamily)